MLFEQIRGKQRCTARQSKAKAKSAIQKPIKQTQTHMIEREYIYMCGNIYLYIYICIRIFTYACILYMNIYFGFVFGLFFVTRIYTYVYLLFKI